jgi:hypothetical protein
MRSPDAILALYRDRKASHALLHRKMQEIADVYNGRAEVPLPDMDRDEQPSIPNLLQQGVDQMAGRITSVTPNVIFSSMKPGVRKYDRAARAASQTIQGWWQDDRVMLKQKTRGRRLIAYGMAPTVLRWDFEDHKPTWQLRHPLETYAPLNMQPGDVQPVDCIFTFKRTYGWLNANGYGEHLRALVNRREELKPDGVVTLMEYIDGDHTVLMATGYYSSGDYAQGSWADVNALRGVVLEAYPTLTEDSPVTIPTRLTLDEMTGQFDGMLGMYYQQAKLMALETIAVEKGIFPDTYLVSRPGEIAKFVDGPHDGRTGRVNVVTGGTIQSEQSQPGYLTNPTIDRLERAQRVTSGIPAEFGGESGTNIRTGRRGDAVLSATIDFPIAEAQEIFAFALEEENEAAMQLAKRIEGNVSRTIYVGTGNSRRPVTYVANETFENEEHVVAYPAAGTDVNSLIIGIGQRVGLGIMSKETAANLDPYVDNPEVEHDNIVSEALEQALLAGIQQKASTGELPPLVLAKVASLVKSDKMELYQAMQKATDDALKEQEAATPGAPPATPDAAAADPTVAALTGSAIPGPNQTQQDLGSLMSTLRKPAMTIQPGRGIARGAV